MLCKCVLNSNVTHFYIYRFLFIVFAYAVLYSRILGYICFHIFYFKTFLKESMIDLHMVLV